MDNGRDRNLAVLAAHAGGRGQGARGRLSDPGKAPGLIACKLLCSGGMSMAAQDTVRASFNYTRDTGVQPEIYFYEPPAGIQTHLPGDDPRDMDVHDGWSRAGDFSLDREGFALREFPS